MKSGSAKAAFFFAPVGLLWIDLALQPRKDQSDRAPHTSDHKQQCMQGVALIRTEHTKKPNPNDMAIIPKQIVLALLVVSTSVIFTNCRTTKEGLKKSNVSKRSGENFDAFYDRFHKDSAFQISRTVFPLGGQRIDGLATKKWTRDNLPIMKAKIFDVDTTQYKVSYKKTENTFIQKVQGVDSGFISECRFELIDKKWYLVYVLDKDF